MSNYPIAYHEHNHPYEYGNYAGSTIKWEGQKFARPVPSYPHKWQVYKDTRLKDVNESNKRGNYYKLTISGAFSIRGQQPNFATRKAAAYYNSRRTAFVNNVHNDPRSSNIAFSNRALRAAVRDAIIMDVLEWNRSH